MSNGGGGTRTYRTIKHVISLRSSLLDMAFERIRVKRFEQLEAA